jgi:hypothetical protein
MHRWCTQQVLFVDDVARAAHFCVDMFKTAWRERIGRDREEVDKDVKQIIRGAGAARRSSSWLSNA